MYALPRLPPRRALAAAHARLYDRRPAYPRARHRHVDRDVHGLQDCAGRSAADPCAGPGGRHAHARSQREEFGRTVRLPRRDRARQRALPRRRGGVPPRRAAAAVDGWRRAGRARCSKRVDELLRHARDAARCRPLPPAGRWAANPSSSLSNAPHVHHEQTHLYVAEPFIDRAAEIVTRLLFGEPAPAGGNLHLMLPYYGEATFYGRRLLEDVPVVSNVQLFLDLAGYSLRGPEAARMLVKGPLARQLSLDRSHVKTLTSGLE